MNDIELAQSLKRRATSAKEFGESLYVKADDVIALVEVLEKAQGMEAYWKTQCRGITDHCEELQARIAELESRTVAVKQGEVLVTVAGLLAVVRARLLAKLRLP